MAVSYQDRATEKREHKTIETLDLDQSLVEAFERIVATFPSRIALGSDLWQPTYRELNEAANRFAHRLVANGAEPGDRAVILMPHDTPMVAAILGVLKTGQIAVPLDPGDPLSRLKLLIEDAEPSVIVTDLQTPELAAELTSPDCRTLNFELETAIGAIANPLIEISPGETAFLTYTSGTTGRPKAVMKPHRQLLGINSVYAEAIGFTEQDRIPLFASASTGQGVQAIWWALLNGAMLCPFSVKTKGVAGLADWIIARELTVYISSASICRTLIKTIDDQLAFSKVRAVGLASESVTSADLKTFRKHFPKSCVFVHGLATSETGNIAWSRWAHGDKLPEGALPVGRFARNTTISLLGDDGQPVARGDVGEIAVKSRHVATGYWRDPELTAKHFSADLDGKGTRLVRTGDMGRINADGMLELRGRKDDRIKIRGNRIEVTEIEHCLERLAGIDRVAVVAVRRQGHEPMLVAFVVKADTASWTAQRLRHTMRATLSPQMVPSRIVFLDRLPYNMGNKIDREALRQYALPDRADTKSDHPRTETEELLAALWAESLELPAVGRDDDFFDLGGDSLMAAVVAAQVHATLGIELSLGKLAAHPTLSALATFIDRCRQTTNAPTPPIVAVPRTPSMPLSLTQEAMWPACQGPEFTDLTSYRITGPLDVEVFKDCLNQLVERHEILRTTFAQVDGRPAQIIHSSAPLDFSMIDLSGCENAESQADLIFRDAALRAIDLATLPIMRHVLIKIAPDYHRWARIINFMISDGFSGRMLETELATLYEARTEGRALPLPKCAPLQYADFAVWQREVSRPDTPHFQDATNWWKAVFLTAAPAAQLPVRRFVYRPNLNPCEGLLPWTLEEQAAKRLDEIAHRAGTTPFIARLAAFAVLLSDLTGRSTVVIGTFFDNRDCVEAQTIAGRLVNFVPLVFCYDSSKTFLHWLQTVHRRVFETLAHSDIPFQNIQVALGSAGIQTPQIQCVFMLSCDHADQRFDNLAISHEPWIAAIMPPGCTVYVDGKKPENCQLRFDAKLYGRKEMRAVLNSYLRLLAVAAREPELPLGTLLAMTGAKPLRLIYAKFVATLYELLKPYYDASAMLRAIWRPIKRWIASNA
jgi:amino acid adenylation domain-containing protein